MATEEEMMMEEAMMGERPPIPMGMEAPARQDPLESMPMEARNMMMEPDEEIEIVLMARLANISPEDLSVLDAAITPEVSMILMKILPELGDILDKVEAATPAPPEPEASAGALGAL
mgnify:FL=1|tara:strand:+ start:643 stop:993 length:351 start_codon:yes stop_codon:yes gene_type:complete